MTCSKPVGGKATRIFVVGYELELNLSITSSQYA